MKNLILKRYGNEYPMTFNLNNYKNNGNLYIGMITNTEGYDEHWSDLTVNFATKCEENCAYIDTNNNGDGIIAWLEEHGLGNATGKYKKSGFCWYPEFKFNMENLLQYVH